MGCFCFHGFACALWRPPRNRHGKTLSIFELSLSILEVFNHEASFAEDLQQGVSSGANSADVAVVIEGFDRVRFPEADDRWHAGKLG
jgi:hypothetical protein